MLWQRVWQVVWQRKVLGLCIRGLQHLSLVNRGSDLRHRRGYEEQTKERIRMHRSSDRQGDCTAGSSTVGSIIPSWGARRQLAKANDGFPRALHNLCRRQQRAATGVAASGAREATVAALFIPAAGHAVRVDGVSWRERR